MISYEACVRSPSVTPVHSSLTKAGVTGSGSSQSAALKTYGPHVVVPPST